MAQESISGLEYVIIDATELATGAGLRGRVGCIRCTIE